MIYNYLNYFTQDTIKKVNNWDKKLSPITASALKKTSFPEPQWWLGSVQLGKSPIGLFFTDNPLASAGTSIFPKEALMRTLGETLERYSSTNSHLLDKPYLKLVDEQLEFIRCADFESTLPSFKAEGITSEIEHSKVTRLIDGLDEYLPYEHVHLGFLRTNKQLMHTSPISTGCAFYYDSLTAIWKGICEVVERDAMMRLWYTKSQPIKIKMKDVLDYSLYSRIKKIRNAGLKVHVFEISSTVGIPVIYTIIQGEQYPYYCVGASADLNITKAINKSIDEAISIRVVANWSKSKGNKAYDYTNFYWVDHLEKHMELYANWKDTPAFDFLLNSNLNEVSLHEVEHTGDYLTQPNTMDDLVDIASIFKNKGFDIYYKDITVPEVKEYGHVMKVVIPQMIPLSQAYACRWLSPFQAAYEAGQLNPYPHPFA